jgi:hypothetical protein
MQTGTTDESSRKKDESSDINRAMVSRYTNERMCMLDKVPQGAQRKTASLVFHRDERTH